MEKDGFHPHTNHQSAVHASDVQQIKEKVLPLDEHAIKMMKFKQGQAKRDRIAVVKWDSMNEQQKINALKKAGVRETDMWGNTMKTRKQMAKLRYIDLPHYAKTDLAFQVFKLDRNGHPIK